MLRQPKIEGTLSPHHAFIDGDFPWNESPDHHAFIDGIFHMKSMWSSMKKKSQSSSIYEWIFHEINHHKPSILGYPHGFPPWNHCAAPWECQDSKIPAGRWHSLARWKFPVGNQKRIDDICIYVCMYLFTYLSIYLFIIIYVCIYGLLI